MCVYMCFSMNSLQVYTNPFYVLNCYQLTNVQTLDCLELKETTQSFLNGNN